MKKLFIALFLFAGCNSSDNMDKVKKEISNKVPQFITKVTSGGVLLKDCKLYQLDKITDKDALDFRIRALSDSLEIQQSIINKYKRIIEMKEIDMKSFDSLKISTDEIKSLIAKYSYRSDSTSTASIDTKKMLDSLSSIKNTDAKNKNFYSALFDICSFNITTISSCDSVAFLFDNDLNIISIHGK